MQLKRINLKRLTKTYGNFQYKEVKHVFGLFRSHLFTSGNNIIIDFIKKIRE